MRGLIGILLALVWAGLSLAQERITDFEVDIAVEASGDIVITETIRVISEGDQIRRGIFRELPTRYTFMGVSQSYEYELLSVSRDGNAESVSASRQGNALTWRIGRADVFLNPGPHQYELRYRVGDAIRRHDDRAELYWNATGTYWAFPIERAQATVRFPEDAIITDNAVYTGRFGGSGSNATIEVRGNSAIFETTAPLARREGLTVSSSIAPGVIAPLSDARKAELFWIRYGAAILLSLGGLGLGLYYYLTWNRIGRDPQKPPVFPRYEPPKGYSPAAVHYIHHKGFKGMDAMSSLMMQLATQGVLEIDADKKKTTIRQLDWTVSGRDAQTFIREFLKGRKGKLVLDGQTDSKFYQAVSAFHHYLAQTYGPNYYRRNLGWALFGFLLSIALIIVVVLSPVAKNGGIVLGLFGGIVILNLVFAFLLPAPTKRGAALSSEIEGFKLYLEMAEKDRINMADPLGNRPPAMTVALYERFLPFAMALGVEKPWTKQFETSLPREAKTYQPTHIHGNAFRPGRGPIDISKTLGKTLTAGVAAAAPVSQSSGSSFSSGSGGGGFSGGGGGGGGGGGW